MNKTKNVMEPENLFSNEKQFFLFLSLWPSLCSVLVSIDSVNIFNDLKIVAASVHRHYRCRAASTVVANHQSETRYQNLLQTDKFSLNINFAALFFVPFLFISMENFHL